MNRQRKVRVTLYGEGTPQRVAGTGAVVESVVGIGNAGFPVGCPLAARNTGRVSFSAPYRAGDPSLRGERDKEGGVYKVVRFNASGKAQEGGFPPPLKGGPARSAEAGLSLP